MLKKLDHDGAKGLPYQQRCLAAVRLWAYKGDDSRAFFDRNKHNQCFALQRYVTRMRKYICKEAMGVLFFCRYHRTGGIVREPVKNEIPY